MASAIVPAAGSATRFGGGKLIADVDGIPLLDRTIGALLGAGVDEIVIVIAPGSDWAGDVRSLRDDRVRTTVNPDPSRGMFSSIQIGAAAVSDMPMAVLPADMPFVRAETVKLLIQTALRTGGIVSPRYDGRRGHPVVLPPDLRNVLLSAPASSTLKDVLSPHAARFHDVVVDDRGVVRDVDVPEDLTR